VKGRTRSLDDLGLTVLDEYGLHFETGVPVTFKFLRGTARAPYLGDRFQQDIEPVGRYMAHNPNPGDLAPDWQTGTLNLPAAKAGGFWVGLAQAACGSRWVLRTHLHIRTLAGTPVAALRQAIHSDVLVGRGARETLARSWIDRRSTPPAAAAVPQPPSPRGAGMRRACLP
jgi:hypothetical protein